VSLRGKITPFPRFLAWNFRNSDGEFFL